MSTAVWPSLPPDALKQAEDDSTVRFLFPFPSSELMEAAGPRIGMASRLATGNACFAEEWVGRMLCVTGSD